MPVQRPPPQRANPPSASTPRVVDGDRTLPTPSRAFMPSKPAVVRTPPTGISAGNQSQLQASPAALQTDDVLLETEEAMPEAMPEAGPSTTPARIKAASPIRDPAPAPVTPAPKTPRSTKTPAQVLAEPAIPIPIDDFAAEDWGKRYEITLDTLELAVRAGAQNWTAKNLEECFPLISAQHPKAIENVYINSSQKMRTKILADAKSHLAYYKVGPALQMIDQVVSEARSNTSSAGRPDAWRPDVSPYALTAATNLPIYDEAYGRLRAESLGLHEDCQSRFQSIRAKQEALREMEGAVSDGVVELEKTIQLLEVFPSEEMMQWMEDTVGKLEGGRAA